MSAGWVSSSETSLLVLQMPAFFRCLLVSFYVSVLQNLFSYGHQSYHFRAHPNGLITFLKKYFIFFNLAVAALSCSTWDL